MERILRFAGNSAVVSTNNLIKNGFHKSFFGCVNIYVFA